MTAPPQRRTISALTVRLLALYRGEPAMAVLERAVRLLAQADGHLDHAGRIRSERQQQAARRRT